MFLSYICKCPHVFCISFIFYSIQWDKISKNKRNHNARHFLKLYAVSTEENEESDKWEELQGHMDCPRTFNKFLNVDQPIQITDKYKSSEEEVEEQNSMEMQSVLVPLANKDKLSVKTQLFIIIYILYTSLFAF